MLAAGSDRGGQLAGSADAVRARRPILEHDRPACRALPVVGRAVGHRRQPLRRFERRTRARPDHHRRRQREDGDRCVRAQRSGAVDHERGEGHAEQAGGSRRPRVERGRRHSRSRCPDLRARVGSKRRRQRRRDCQRRNVDAQRHRGERQYGGQRRRGECRLRAGGACRLRRWQRWRGWQRWRDRQHRQAHRE